MAGAASHLTALNELAHEQPYCLCQSVPMMSDCRHRLLGVPLLAVTGPWQRHHSGIQQMLQGLHRPETMARVSFSRSQAGSLPGVAERCPAAYRSPPPQRRPRVGVLNWVRLAPNPCRGDLPSAHTGLALPPCIAACMQGGLLLTLQMPPRLSDTLFADP